MACLDLTHPGCLHFEDMYANNDVRILGRMAHNALSCLYIDVPYSDKEKAIFAALAIAKIYDESNDILSTVAKRKYYISIEKLNDPIYKSTEISNSIYYNKETSLNSRKLQMRYELSQIMSKDQVNDIMSQYDFNVRKVYVRSLRNH